MDDAQVVRLRGGDSRCDGGERLDAASRGAGAKASRKCHGHWGGNSSAVVRSKPNAMLKHSTPWPEAPLIRLSSAAVTTAFLPWAATLTRHRLVWLAGLEKGLLASAPAVGSPAVTPPQAPAAAP